MKKLLCLLGGAMLAIQLRAQTIQPLAIGDSVPDLVFNQVMNSTESNFKLSDFKGKLVILDFFGTWCGACVGSIPKIDSLQKVMGDQLKVIVICEDVSNKVVTNYIKKKWNSQEKKISLPFVLYDSTTISLFPHRMIPHEVWISPEGKLMATTGSKEVTLAHIKEAIQNPDIKMKQKIDQMNFDREKPLFVDGNGGSMKPLVSKSIFSHKINGIGSSAGIVIDSINHKKRIYFINVGPMMLIQRPFKFPRNRVMFQSDDTLNFVLQINHGWFKDSMYCYELTVADTTSTELINQIMRDDVLTNLNANAHIEKIMMDCFVLKKIDDRGLFEPNNPSKYIGRINVLLHKLENNNFFPTIDETNIGTNKINFNISPASYDNLSSINKALKKRGLKLSHDKRKIEVLIISKK